MNDWITNHIIQVIILVIHPIPMTPGTSAPGRPLERPLERAAHSPGEWPAEVTLRWKFWNMIKPAYPEVYAAYIYI